MLNRFLPQLPQPKDVVAKELHIAQLSLLEAYGAQESANGRATILETRVARLKETLKSFEAVAA